MISILNQTQQDTHDTKRTPVTTLKTVTEEIKVPVKGSDGTVNMATQVVSKQVPVVEYKEETVKVPYYVNRVRKIPKHVQVNAPDTILVPHIVEETVKFEVPVYTKVESPIYETIEVEDCSENDEVEMVSNNVYGSIETPQLDLTH